MIDKFVNPEWLDAEDLARAYADAKPFPHIVMKHFINSEFLERVAEEFPDLSDEDPEKRMQFNTQREIKFASKGIDLVSPSAYELVSFFNSEFFLRYLQQLTGIKEKLIGDPYLSGGGYHEIKRGGLLKVHADFNQHPSMKLDRRLNLLLYLNRDWDDNWGGDLQLFDRDMSGPVIRVFPHFNTCVIFTTTSFSYHGHPDPITCPEDRSRRSLALYYFSTGRPASETIGKHSSLFKKRTGEDFEGEDFDESFNLKDIALDLCPPILARHMKKLIKRTRIVKSRKGRIRH